MNDKKTEIDLGIDNLPNRITVIRIALIPVIVICLMIKGTFFNWFAALTFVVAAFSDFLDGYIARKQKIVTVFGTQLDHIADKFLVVSSLIMLQDAGRLAGYIVIILVLREMYITSLRLFAAQEGFSVPVDKLGKWKTATQMIGIPMMMANSFHMSDLGFVFILVSMVLSIYSACQYSLGFIQKFKIQLQNKKKGEA